ncbi:putative transcriptional regulator, Crp/Fnr family [Hydrogenobacter thermophilus TK-6]|uniref:Crp/Fnr family transcriptional regulator n=1 Tax=Hydrogenobacter thermophilus TaxID=940 RepID=UPI0001E6568C|nr:Crp/Fnr family transcriptional regulator [Hydrogenobacter thermophilus]ADO45519.1 putative transcriptional regulator, Crp/Fnr family [Hydrogenobacter thermophilus TK-6]
MDALEKLRRYLPAGYVEERKYSAKENILPSKFCGEGLCIISNGVAELCIKSKVSKRTLDIMLPGDIFGFMSDISLMKNFTVIALTSVSLFYVNMDNLKRLGNENPILVLDIFSLALSKQAYLYEVLATLRKPKAKDRIRSFLSLLAKIVEEKKTNLIIKRKQIAGITGLSYENVVRTMSRIQKQESRRVRLW